MLRKLLKRVKFPNYWLLSLNIGLVMLKVTIMEEIDQSINQSITIL